jgi:hypothetical protein
MTTELAQQKNGILKKKVAEFFFPSRVSITGRSLSHVGGKWLRGKRKFIFFLLATHAQGQNKISLQSWWLNYI